MQLKLKKDKDIKRKNYDSKEEYKFDKNTDLIPKRINKLICIMFTEDKGCFFLARKINSKKNFFRFRKGKYIFDNESIHLTRNANRISFYLEGISTPIKMSNIEKYLEEIEYIDLDGSKKTANVSKIKGLKYDASILDTFTDEHFAEDFTKMSMDNFQIYILILVIISLILSGIGIGVSYFFK